MSYPDHLIHVVFIQLVMLFDTIIPSDVAICTVVNGSNVSTVNLDQQVSTICDLDLDDITVYKHVRVKESGDLEKIGEFTETITILGKVSLGKLVLDSVTRIQLCENDMDAIRYVTAPSLEIVSIGALGINDIVDTLRVLKFISEKFYRLDIEYDNMKSLTLDDHNGSIIKIEDMVTEICISDGEDFPVEWLSNFPNVFLLIMMKTNTEQLQNIQAVLPKLVEIAINETEDLDLGDITTCKLEVLRITYTAMRITDEGNNICDFSELKELVITLDEGHEDISKLIAPKLESLTISGYYSIIPQGIAENLKSLSLHKYEYSVADLHLNNIEKLSLFKCNGSICIDRRGRVVNYAKLDSLDMLHCTSSIECLDAPVLESLKVVTTCDDHSGVFLAKLDNLKKLTFNIHRISNFNREYIKDEICFPLLEYLYINNVRSIMRGGCFPFKLPELNTIRVYDSFLPGDESYDLTCLGKLDYIFLTSIAGLDFVRPNTLTFSVASKNAANLIITKRVTVTMKTKAKSAYK